MNHFEQYVCSEAEVKVPCRECPFRRAHGIRVSPDDALAMARDVVARRLQPCHMGGAPFTGGRTSACRGAVEFGEVVVEGRQHKRVFESIPAMVAGHAKSDPRSRGTYDRSWTDR